MEIINEMNLGQLINMECLTSGLDVKQRLALLGFIRIVGCCDVIEVRSVNCKENVIKFQQQNEIQLTLNSFDQVSRLV